MKLLTNNLAQDSITTVTASSSKTTFPVSNIKQEFRAKEWRSNGNFVITSSNNTASLDEGSGALAVTVTTGTYTPETLAVAVKAALELLGANTYTVTFSRSTGLWSITSTVNFSLSGTLLAVLGFTASISGAMTYTSPNPAIHTEEWVLFDLRSTEPVDTVALLWERGGYKLTDTAIIIVEANATNVWTSPAFTQTLTYNDKNEIAQAHFTAENYRYWRIKIVDPTCVSVYVHLGVVVLGQSDQVITRTSNGFSFGVKDYSKVITTDFGQRYTDVYPKLKTLSLNFDVLDLDETTQLLALFDQVGTQSTIYISLDPAETMFTQNEFWIYGKLNSDLSLSHRSLDIFNSSIQVVETN
jgi:hypothetical protein